MNGIKSLLNLQEQLRELPDERKFEHDRTQAMLKIMAFLRRTGKLEIYKQQVCLSCFFYYYFVSLYMYYMYYI